MPSTVLDAGESPKTEPSGSLTSGSLRSKGETGSKLNRCSNYKL